MKFDWVEHEQGFLYSEFEESFNAVGVSVYEILSLIGVYASGLAILVSAILLIINAGSGGEKLADAKKYVVRVLVVSILIFGVSGLVLTVANAGF